MAVVRAQGEGPGCPHGAGCLGGRLFSLRPWVQVPPCQGAEPSTETCSSLFWVWSLPGALGLPCCVLVWGRCEP